MKVHYITILLFDLPLNILVNTHKKPSITPHHTQKIPTTRLLCEYDLYIPNYDNDPQMKEVMDNFNKQIQQRFEEYDDRMVEKRKQCKDKCDKEIQKIILKDKLEKELTEKFVTLQTDIQSDAIPTCVCEKSMADKTEKFCLNCGKTMGGVAPGWGLVGGLMYAGWTNYVAGIAAKAATKVGIDKAIEGLGNIYTLSQFSYMDWTAKITATTYDKVMELVQIVNQVSNMCVDPNPAMESSFCMASLSISNNGQNSRFIELISKEAAKAATKAGEVAKDAELAEVANYASTTSSLSTGITASIIAIVVIVLIMVIIYLILRYRRKKKMKKKLQYIKLLEE
ncbi:rifin PIR protein, putative [Plasmodium reichenowi]|uniref:Rifin PIR protein, putative n=1 Tax=Plasmodium reichenowi TaxID=5854 RepID=A0A2P9DD93_PLARE|nr:rifin PIR protein, putative [Plasmodium reichenowi]